MKIEYYDLENGSCPVREFIDSQDKKMRAKAFEMIDLLKEYGPALRGPFSKPLINGLFELRVKQGSNNIRILYFFIIGDTAVLTNGFIKETQKTPRAEILLAKKYRADYKRRNKL